MKILLSATTSDITLAILAFLVVAVLLRVLKAMLDYHVSIVDPVRPFILSHLH